MLEVHIRHGQTGPDHRSLSDQGQQEAAEAGKYLRTHFPGRSWLGFRSPSLRARQTAEGLGCQEIDWQVDERLKELDWGSQPAQGEALQALMKSPEYRCLSWHMPPDGETWEAMARRVGEACRDIDRGHAGKDRLVVSHGGTLMMARFFREGFDGSTFGTLFEKPYKYFLNCQLVIYSDEDPENGERRPGNLWVASVCPWEPDGRFGHGWLAVT